MSFDAKLILFAGVLAVTVPLMVMVLRRMVSGKPFRKPKLGDMQMPPPGGPSVDGGG